MAAAPGRITTSNRRLEPHHAHARMHPRQIVRLDPRADLPDGTTPKYGPLEAIARNKINRQKIHTQWADMTRVAGSLVTNQVRAYDLLRMFARGGRPTPLGQAFAEYGRIDKTLHLLHMPLDLDG